MQVKQRKKELWVDEKEMEQTLERDGLALLQQQQQQQQPHRTSHLKKQEKLLRPLSKD